jgi:ATP-binding cassette subfamily C protein
VECKDVTFSYPISGKPILRGLSLVVPGGAVAAVTGANGTGKTTLLKLLCGALRPDDGEILVGGVPLDSATLPAFRHRLGAVFQDNLLLSHSLLDNVTLRDPAVAPVALKAALADSGAESMVRRIPGGLRARVGNGGRVLSGGEIQKVAIARALARTPSLLVFDEVTNHLDAPSRAAFCELLESLRGRCTVLLVTHDPEVLRRCDLEIPLEPSP